MRTLKEQYKAIIAAKTIVQGALERETIDSMRWFLSETIDALLDAAETIKRTESLFNFITDTFKG